MHSKNRLRDWKDRERIVFVTKPKEQAKKKMAESTDFSNLTAPLNVEDEAIRKWNKALNKEVHKNEALTKSYMRKLWKLKP